MRLIFVMKVEAKERPNNCVRANQPNLHIYMNRVSRKAPGLRPKAHLLNLRA